MKLMVFADGNNFVMNRLTVGVFNCVSQGIRYRTTNFRHDQ